VSEASVNIELPAHLCRLAGVAQKITLMIEGNVTQQTILDALEAAYPMLRGTIRDQTTKVRRPFIRFFACEQDLSHLSPGAELPQAVVNGQEPFLIVGAIAGG